MRKQAKHQSKHKHKQTWCLNQRCQGPQPWQAWADLALVCEVHCSSILVVFPQLWQWQWPWRWGWSVLLLSQPELWGQQHPRVEPEITHWNTQRHIHNESSEVDRISREGGRKKEGFPNKLWPKIFKKYNINHHRKWHSNWDGCQESQPEKSDLEAREVSLAASSGDRTTWESILFFVFIFWKWLILSSQ